MSSKLHLYSVSGGPFCGRQLRNHRALRAQDNLGTDFTLDNDTFNEALAKGAACRWCAARAGLITKPMRSSWRDELDEEEGNE